MSGASSAPRLPRAHPDARVARVARFFDDLAPADLDRLGEVYSTDAAFKDPFNEVRGLEAIRRIFAHMYAELDGPRFVVTQAVAEGDVAFLTWTFHFRSPRLQPQDVVVRGATQLAFDPHSGLVVLHRDYWDTGEELYARLPLLGALMRWLRRRGSATQA